MNGLIHRLRETRLGDTVYRGLRTRISRPGWGGFHRDRVYQSLVLDLIQAFGFSSFVETGTDHGYSTELVASRFPKLPVFTTELVESTYQRAKRSLDRYPNITMILGSSDEALKQLLDEEKLGPSPLFYLDAHWHTYWPLRSELKWIGQAGLPSAIVIDDFEVPGQPQFGYDTYGGDGVLGGSRCNLEYIRHALVSGHDYRAVFPRYSANDAYPTGAGMLRGSVILFQDMPKQYEAFLERTVARNHYFGHGVAPQPPGPAVE